MSGYNLLLMKVTHLHRNITEDSSDSGSAICYNAGNDESLAFNLSSGSKISFNSFIVNLFPKYVLFELVRSQNQDAKGSFEKSGVGDNDCFTRLNLSNWQFVILKLFSDQVRAFVVILCQLTYCFSFIYKITPDCFPESIFVVVRSEILFAN